MKKTIFLLLFSLSLFAQAPTSFQYGVRTPTLFPWNGTNKIDVNGRLKLNTTAGGFIPAAMTTTQRLAVASPQTGESVYDVTLGKYYHWDGSGWVVSGGSGGNLAATLALDNKTNSIPFSSNDESSQILLDDSSNVSITSGASSQRQLLLAEDSFYFNSNVRYVFDGKGIDMNTVSDGFGLPRLTTTAMNAIVAPTEGMLVRNTTESSIYQYDGATWEPLASAAQTLDQTTTEGNTTANDIIVTDSNGTTLTSKGYSQYVETSSGKQLFVTPNLLSYKRGSFYYNVSPPATLSVTREVEWPDKSGTVAFLDDVSAPTLPEEQIAFGQTGDAFGSSSNLTFHGNRYLKVIAPSTTTSGITVGDGYLSTDAVGVYSLSADETIADYNPTSTVYNYSNGNYNYNDTTSTHNFVGAVKVGGVDALTTSTGQALDSDLTDISSLAPPNDNILQRKAGVWTSRTPAQLKTDLALVKGDLGLGNVDNTTDLNKPISTATQSALDLKENIVSGVVASGTNTYTATYSPTITYTDGLKLVVRFTNANTTAATININSLGAKSIVKGVSTALVSGDIPAFTTLLLAYDGTNFVIVGSQLVNQFFDWSPTYGGFSVVPSGGFNRYSLQDKLCHFYIAPTVNGTSNANLLTVTLPFNAKNLQVVPISFCIDSSVLTVGGFGLIDAGSNVMTITKQNTGVFNSSGAKRVVVQAFYEIQ